MYGSKRTADENTEGYYIFQWTSEPYILQEDNKMKGYIPLVTAYAGEIVSNVVFLNILVNTYE